MKTPAITSDGLMTLKEAARFLGISTTTFYETILKDGLIATVRIGGRRQVPRRALVEFAEARIEASS